MLFLVLFATATDEFIIAGLLPLIADDLDVSIAAAGQLITVFAVVYAISAPTLAVVFDRFPKRGVMISGLAVFAVANIAAAFAPGYWILMLARAVAALCAAVVTSAAFTSAAVGAPAGRQGRYLSVLTAGMTVALITGVPLGSWLGGAVGWRATFLLIAAVGVIAAAGLGITGPKISGSAPAPLRERLRPLHDPAVLRLVMVSFLVASGGLMFYSYLAPYTAYVAWDSPSLLTTLLFVVGVAGFGGALFSGRLTDRLGPRLALPVVVGGHTLALALLAVLALTGFGYPILLGMLVALWAVFAWGTNPPIQGSIMAAVGSQVGMTALAMNIAGLYLGTGVAGALGGALISLVGVRYLPIAAALMTLLSLSLTLRPARERSAATPDATPANAAGPPAERPESPTPAACG
ncbi:MFS transporter [Nocardiopsis gilva YIM 90087]|uniref:MFS transporter n=1 Tax=Nocardiopsis gilva YIM 90087 TaxID=1235441 RepID=A0A223RZX2_9ACTN|nr:MFS transporter [Nocardiopsis gilva YIM 90087]